MATNSTLKPCYVNSLIDTNFFANFGTCNTFPIHLEIPFGKLKTIMPFPHTSSVLLSPRYILGFKVNFSKVQNTSSWKVKCCETLESTNHASLQTEKINTIVTRSFVLFNVGTCKEPWVFYFNLVYSCDIILQMAFGATIVASSFLIFLFILELPKNTFNN